MKRLTTFVLSFIGLVFCIYILFFVFLAKACNSISDEGDGNFVKGIGKITKEVQKDFNEGYNEDTLIVK